MTKFHGPLSVGTQGAPGTEVNYTTIEASGTAIFSGPITVAPNASAAAYVTLDSSGTSTFEGPVKGPAGVGRMELVQRVTVVDQSTVGNPIAFNLPSGADITDITFLVEVVFTASASAQTAEVVIYLGGGDATAASIIAEARVSATGAYPIMDRNNTGTLLNPARLRNVLTTVHAFISAKAIATVFSGGGQGMLQIRYIHNA